MSPALSAYFTDYAGFHQTRGNQACHYLAIPIIVLSIIALLGSVPLAMIAGFPLTLAEPVILILTLYNLTLDAPLGLTMLVALLVMDAAGRRVPVLVAVGLFIAGWIVQFIGHYAYEGRSPAFFRNIVHLLVGPLWVLAKATGRG